MMPEANRTLFGHPRGLTVLFMTQMWAEFSYFGLQAMLVYYMTQQLGFSQARSSLIYGIYGGAAFFTPLFGGLIADRYLGRARSVALGGTLMMAGHFAMASESLLIPALALVAIGNGLFIPPLAVQVGSLYADDDPRKASAYSAYYMGINLGGLLSPVICGGIGEAFGWHWGFAVAGVGMLAGLSIYLGFRRLLPAEPALSGTRPDAADYRPSAVGASGDIRLLATVIAVVVLFRIGYEQSGNVIALWVQQDTDRSIRLFGKALAIPATWFQSINPLLIIVLTPFLVRLWAKGRGRETSAHLMRRMSLGCVLAAASMIVMVVAALAHDRSGAPVSLWWVIGYFVLLTMGELLVIPVGLALVDMLSPARFAAMAMGAWYLAKFMGSLLAGVMGTYWGVVPATVFFAIGTGSVLVSAVLLLIYARAEGRQSV